MVAILARIVLGGGPHTIAWAGEIKRYYERGRLHREGGPAVAIKGTYEAWVPAKVKKRVGGERMQVFQRLHLAQR
jgi:hypothetical protein